MKKSELVSLVKEVLSEGGGLDFFGSVDAKNSLATHTNRPQSPYELAVDQVAEAIHRKYPKAKEMLSRLVRYAGKVGKGADQVKRDISVATQKYQKAVA